MDRHQAPPRQAPQGRSTKAGADALLVTNFTNVTYLTGFTGDDSYLLVRPDGEVLISDPRYTTQLEEECPGLDAASFAARACRCFEAVVEVLRVAGIGRLAIEADSMTVRLARPDRREAAEAGDLVDLRPGRGAAADQGQGGDRRDPPGDAVCGEGVCRAAGRACGRSRPRRRWPTSWSTRCGCSGPRRPRFPSIVAVGPAGGACRTPRRPSSRLGEADFVLIDWGANGRLYKSDLTRVLVTGRISPKLRRVYGVVLSAQTPGDRRDSARRSGPRRRPRRPRRDCQGRLRPPVRPRPGARAGAGDPRGAPAGRQEPRRC